MRFFKQNANSRKAVIIVGHGSREKGFQAAMEKVASGIRKDGRFGEVVCAYLEITAPSIERAIERCVKKKAAQIRVLPYFVLTGNHVLYDIPGIVRQAAARHSGKAKIILCPYLGYHPKLVAVVRQRIREGKP